MPGFEVSSVLSYQGVSLNTPIFPGQGLFLNQLPVGGWLIFGLSKLFKCSSVQEPVKSKKKNFFEFNARRGGGALWPAIKLHPVLCPFLAFMLVLM